MSTERMHVRNAEEREIDHLARLWYEGWQDAHAQILPAELRRLRALDGFRQRLQAALPNTRVVGPRGAPYGFCITKGDEFYQIYVSAHARGSGAAGAYQADRQLVVSLRSALGTAYELLYPKMRHESDPDYQNWNPEWEKSWPGWKTA